eukprot:3782539-Pyramimonas_sp.AAC.1
MSDGTGLRTTKGRGRRGLPRWCRLGWPQSSSPPLSRPIQPPPGLDNLGASLQLRTALPRHSRKGSGALCSAVCHHIAKLVARRGAPVLDVT